MRYIPHLIENKGHFVGDNAINARVTIESSWMLKKTFPIYGSSVRGPYRYYKTIDGDGPQHEVPNIKSISINRTLAEDVATCTIVMYNQWHEPNASAPELSSQLGKPGYFWPTHGSSSNVWNQSPPKGAYRRDGTWDAGFSWVDALIPYGLLYTWQGYGGMPKDGNYISVQDNIDSGNVVSTGVWLIESVSAGSDGMMTIECKDIGKLLLDQVVFPPTVPDGLYPLEYFPAGKSFFDSYWGPKARTGLAPGSKGPVRIVPYSHSGSLDPSVSSGYPLYNAVDGQDGTFSLTDAHPTPNVSSNPWFQFTADQPINSLKLVPWGGGYTCYIHVLVGGSWMGSSSVNLVNSGSFNYVKKIYVPAHVPDGFESALNIDLPQEYNVQRLIVSFDNLAYSPIPNASGDRYRAGIRSLMAYREGQKIGEWEPSLAALPWTFAIESHPTNGYWVAETDGTIHGFGDASEYDSDNISFGRVPVETKHPRNFIIDIASHPDGKGYWALDPMGNIWAYGSASHHGQYNYPWFNTSGKWADDGPSAYGIAATYTGNGYYVVYSNGVVRAFGDAVNTPGFSPSGVYNIPITPLTTFMMAYQPNNQTGPGQIRYGDTRRGNGVAAHPFKLGCWVVDGSAQVFAIGVPHYGQLVNRVYDKGLGSEFRMGNLEWTKSIEATATGNGYWIALGGGKIAAFGDARAQGPGYSVYQGSASEYEENVLVDPKSVDTSFFRALVWSITRDPDGTGFWVLNASGGVFPFNAEFWGQPSYWGGTGVKWHEGNFDGEASSIVKDIVRWGGFTLYEPNPSGEPMVFGDIESTGITFENVISGDKWDMASFWDVIRELAEVVGYVYGVDEEGRFFFRSPNWWRAGNFDEDGTPIYVLYDEDGTFERVPLGTPGAEPYIPLMHESENMFSYSTSLSSTDLVSNIIIGSNRPDPRDNSRTSFVSLIPPAAKRYVAPGIPAMRGIEKQAIWTSQIFESEEEMRIMAETISIHAWFAERMGNVSVAGNPILTPDMQIRIAERNTNDTFIHRILSVNSVADLDEGTWTCDLSTHWLGDASNWVITRDQSADPGKYIVISERLDRWQQIMGRGLGSSPQNWTGNRLAMADMKFGLIAASIEESPAWVADGTLRLPGPSNNVTATIEVLSLPIKHTRCMFKLYSESNALLKNVQFAEEGDVIQLGNIGTTSSGTSLTFKVSGEFNSPGNGQLWIRFSSPNFDSVLVRANVIVTE